MCNKCYILHLKSQCENLRSYILNSFSENDREKFLKECCKGKLFDNVLKTFKPAISNIELEQELTELKEKAIVPRFKFDEECVVIMFGSYHFHRFIAQVKDDLCLTQPYNDTEEWYYVKPEMVFKTLEEAQEKLKEMNGNE